VVKQPVVNTYVIGAGITGLAAASALCRSGRPVTVIERATEPGGLCRTQTRDEFTFDSVSHVLHFRSEKIHEFVGSQLGAALRKVRRNCSIHVQGRYVPYPFQANLGALPISDAAACLMGLISARLSAAPRQNNFGEWIHSTLGDAIGARFMAPYNEKLWGIPVHELATDFLRFVPVPSIGSVLKSFFRADCTSGYNSTFEYPEHGGIQSLIKAIAAPLPDLRLNTEVSFIDCERRELRLSDGTIAPYEHLISTIPLPELRRITGPVPAAVAAACDQLRCVPVLSVTVAINHPDVIADHWVYFPARDVPFFRLFFHSNVAPSAAPKGTSLVSAEIANCNGADTTALAEQTLSALGRLGILRRRQDVRFVHSERFEYGYPVHDLARPAAVACILNYFEARGVQSLGRFGAWHYSSIEDGILEGFAAAEQICEQG
jgi:protoporphyrinogen oxidase